MISSPTAKPIHGGCLAKLMMLFLLIAAMAVLLWVLLLPYAVSYVVQSRTGFGVKIESLSINPFTAKIELRGLALSNPESYPVKEFVTLREFRADAELLSVLRNRLVLDEAVVDVAKVCLAKDREGRRNALVFKQRLLGGAAEPSAEQREETPAPPEGRKSEFLIRKMDLRFDKLVLAEWNGDKALTKEYDISLNQSYENVTSPLQIAMPIVGKVSDLGGAVGDYAGELGRQALENLKKTGATLKEVGKKTGETIKGFFQSLKDKTK